MSTHQHQHHNHEKASWGKRLAVSMIMNLIIPAVQIYGGIISGSMALISDALHNLSDFVSLVINYAALLLGKRGPTHKHTFGFKRVEIFATLISVALLYGAGIYIAIEAWQRFRNPQPIAGQLVIWIALLGFAGNFISALMLRAGSKVNLNMKSAFLHMLSDAATSLVVAILGFVWLYKPWFWLDPVFSWLIVAMILFSGWGLIKDSILILMNATPEGINLSDIQKSLESIDGIKEIHDLHVWNPSAENIALAVHITVPDQMLSTVDDLAEKIRHMLYEKFRIDHPILQFESNSCDEAELLCSTVKHHVHD
ncbi:MAG: cation transporter [Deltaproteobacteria bacterium HGW-Deltaproteobacteria-2]|nr:MAG: cation transporter [Deltaproteobacteria bacterium HGW-Deltaproteobacteria-2]